MADLGTMSAPLESSVLRTPVTIITGFLGAGKTTLVNHVLRERHDHRIAVIENEFGEVGVDDALVLQTEEEIFEMNNGCICCTVRGDLIRILNRLGKKRERFDHIIIETTGLADPAPVAQTFFLDEAIKAAFELDAIITLVDAKHIIEHLDEVKPEGVENEAIEQVAFADKILLNKVDLVTPEAKELVKLRLHAINRYAEIVETQQSQIDLSLILKIKKFDLARIMEMDGEFLSGVGDHQHDYRVSSVGIQLEGAIDLTKLNAWLSRFLATKGTDIFRSKGVLSIAGSDARFVFQGVHMMMGFGNSEDRTDAVAPWKEHELRTNRLVFIGRDLDREQLEASFKSCLA